MDILAAEVGLGPDEIRRRNYLGGGDYFEDLEVPSTLVFDSGHYGPNLDKALELAGYEDLKAEQERRREAGESSSSVSAWLPTSRSAVSPQVVRSEA